MCGINNAIKKVRLAGLGLLVWVVTIGLLSGPVAAFTPSIDEQKNIDQCIEEYLKDKPTPSEEQKNRALDACTTETKCSIGLAGWLLCPIFEIVGQAADASFGFLRHFFLVDPAIVSKPSNFDSWSQVRNLANIGLAVFFLVVIFSQITGYGINSYGIKKAIPKIIMATILINLSYYLSLFLIDLSNIIGNSLATMFKTFEGALFANQEADISTAATTGSAGILIAAVFSIAISTVQTRLLTVVLTMLFAFVITVLITLLFLVAREAIAIILIVMSPLAFLALIFPNTENFYKTWKKGMTIVLMMFPIMAMLFGAASFASAILANSSDSILNQTLALLLSAIPMVFAPGLIKSSIASLPVVGSRIGTFFNKLQTGANQRFTSSGYMKMRAKRDQQRADDLAAGNYQGRHALRRGLSQFNNFLNQRTATGQTRLNEISERSASQLDSLSGRFNESDANLIQAAVARGESSINTTGLSAGARQAIAASGLNGNNISQLAMAGALSAAKRGQLNGEDFDSAIAFANLRGGLNRSTLDDMTEKIRTSSAAKGRFDTSSYIGELQRNSQVYANAATKDANRQTYIERGFVKLNAEDMARMSHGALANGSVGQAAFSNLYRSNPAFVSTVATAQNNAEMSARTSQAIEAAK